MGVAVKDFPPDTIAHMSHGRVTVQAAWVESVRKYRVLEWGVNGEWIDVRELDPQGDPAHATLVGFFRMASDLHRVSLPWRLTDEGKAMAAECPCGPCTWEDPPVKVRCEATPKKLLTAKEKRSLAYKRQKKIDVAVAALIEAQARRIRELELELSEQRRLRDERFERLLAEARAEGEARGRAAADRECTRREKLAARRAPGGQFIKAGAAAQTAEDLHAKRVKAGQASGATRRAKAAKK